MVDEQLRIEVAAAAGAGQLTITEHEVTDFSGFLRPAQIPLEDPHLLLRLYPPVMATLRATAGSVHNLGVREEQVTDETVVFNGTDTARTERLVSSDLVLSFQGLTFDVNGNPITVSVTADAAGELRASQPFYGAAVVSYKSEYRLLQYRYGVSANALGGARVTAGAVLAFYNGEVATYEVEQPSLNDSDAGSNVAVLYRDVSYTILQGSEEYERPPGWPDATWQPLGEPDPDDSWIEVQRVHEIGRINSACFLYTDKYPDIKPAKPFEGSINYEIPIERLMTSDEDLAKRGFSPACLDKAKSRLQELPGPGEDGG